MFHYLKPLISCSFKQFFFFSLYLLHEYVHRSRTVKNVRRICDEARYRTAWMIYIFEDLVIRAMRKYAGAGDLESEAEDDKCDIQDRLRGDDGAAAGYLFVK